MTGKQFIRKVRRLGRKRKVTVYFCQERGKGDHGTLYYGEKFTVVGGLKDDLGRGVLNAMLQQLGLTINELD